MLGAVSGELGISSLVCSLSASVLGPNRAFRSGVSKPPIRLLGIGKLLSKKTDVVVNWSGACYARITRFDWRLTENVSSPWLALVRNMSATL